MNVLGKRNNRKVNIAQALYEMEKEERADTTIIDGKAFDNQKWLRAEQEALSEELEGIKKTTTLDGTFRPLAD